MVWDNTVENAHMLWTINLVATVLSLLGSLLMAFLCTRVPDPKPVSLKLVLAIAISDFCYSIANFLSVFENHVEGPLCKTEAFIRGFFFLLSVFWATCTAILCYKTSTPEKRFDQNLFFKYACYTGISICLILVCIPMFVPSISYKNGRLMCWISVTSPKQATTAFKMFVVAVYGGVPVFLGIVISIFGYGFAIKRVRQLPEEMLELLEINVYKLLWYPAILFFTFAPSVANALIQNYLGTQTGPLVEGTYLTLTHSIGFINALVYGLQRKFYYFGKGKYQNPDISITSGDAHSCTQDLIMAQNAELRNALM